MIQCFALLQTVTLHCTAEESLQLLCKGMYPDVMDVKCQTICLCLPLLHLATEETLKKSDQSVTLAEHNRLISGKLPSMVFIPLKYA